MAAILEATLRSTLRVLKRALESSAWLRKVVYDDYIQAGFSNLLIHEKMIADAVRVDTYAQAIQRHIGPSDRVVDVGTGTGFLALLAARQNPARLYAIDHSDMLEIAEKVASQNGVTSIEFVKTHSGRFAPPEKLDVILHEQMGRDLFNENMVKNLLDLKQRVLGPSGRILPSQFQLFLEPVELCGEQSVPFIWERHVHGIDFSSLAHLDALGPYQARHYRSRIIDRSAIETFLCNPEPILTIDLNQLESESDLMRPTRARKTVTDPGRMDGLCLYFSVDFGDGIGFDTSPQSRYTHWTNRLFRTEPRKYQAGDTIAFNLTMNELIDADSWSITYEA